MAKMLQDQAASAMAIKQQTIAIIDDDPDILKAIGRLLMVCGYGVELFGSAEEFMDKAAASKAACLLVDCQLGQSSGLAMSRELSASGFRFPTIFMTGSEDEAIRNEATRLGCLAFLKKPFEERQLRETIAEAIAASSENKKG